MPPRNRQHTKSRKEVFKEAKSNSTESPSNVKQIENKSFAPWTPLTYTAFKILLSSRLCAAVWSNISDCDEVYNYWDPMHFLLHGKGFQTWEYSPQYAIRSYTYLWLHAIPCFLYEMFLQSNKILVFYYLRCLLAFCSAVCEVYFYKAICQRFGANIGRLTLTFLTMGSGFFISSTAFLPSTFSMYLSTISLAAWFLHKYEISIFATAVSSLVGWPFAVILGLPIAFDIIVMKKKVLLFCKASFVSLFLIMVPLVFTDSRYFGKLVIAPLNIVLYNVFTSHGPDLYGTEPFSFYFLNGVLNFNIAFIAALSVLPLIFLLKFVEDNQIKVYKNPPTYLCFAPMYLWISVFFSLAHKEERFLFPIYPLICLAAAFSIDVVQRMYYQLFMRKKFFDYLDCTNWISLCFCIIFFVLSLSRTLIVYKGYHAPIETFMELNKFSVDEQLHPLPPEYPVNVCIGKEWYRFPSSFFLPDNWSLKFLRSEFKGQLPKPYSNLKNATKIIPTDMNDQNLEERSRYVDIKECDYIIDSDYPNYSSLQPRYSKDKNWNITYSIPFLDAQRSDRFLRAFYIPYFTDYYCEYVDYNLLQRISIRDRLIKRRRKTAPR